MTNTKKNMKKKNIQNTKKAENNNKQKKDTNVQEAAGFDIKKVIHFFKENIKLDIAILFGVCAMVLMLVGTLVMKEPVVPVCLVLILEALIAKLLHNVELWVHALAIVAQIIVGAFIHRIELMLLCVILYVLATAALEFWERTSAKA